MEAKASNGQGARGRGLIRYKRLSPRGPLPGPFPISLRSLVETADEEARSVWF